MFRPVASSLNSPTTLHLHQRPSNSVKRGYSHAKPNLPSFYELNPGQLVNLHHMHEIQLCNDRIYFAFPHNQGHKVVHKQYTNTEGAKFHYKQMRKLLVENRPDLCVEEEQICSSSAGAKMGTRASEEDPLDHAVKEELKLRDFANRN